MSSPIFLIGTQRSGTTLLGRMLSAHGKIFIKNEVPMQKVFLPGANKQAIESAINNSVLERHGKSISDLLASEGKTIWGIKDPQLTYHLDALKQFIPQARFIIITRDARAVVRSYIENAWGLGTNCYTGAQRWKRELEIQLEFEQQASDYTLKLRYEDLITNQRQCLEAICQFIEIPFDESMMSYATQKAFVSKNRQSINTFRAPDSVMIDKWKTGLNQHQIKIINTVCNKILTGLGYEAGESYDEIPTWLKWYYCFHQKIIGELQIQYRWRIGGYRKKFKHWKNHRTQKKVSGV